MATTIKKRRLCVSAFITVCVGAIILIFNPFASKPDADSSNTSETKVETSINDEVETITPQVPPQEEEMPIQMQQPENGETVWGIDVSHWNMWVLEDPHFLTAFKEAGGKFLYIQVAKTTPQGEIANHWEDFAKPMATLCEEHEIPFGFYYLVDADVYSERIMELWYITKFHEEILPMEDFSLHQLPFVLDFEAPTDNQDKSKHLEQLALLLGELEAEGIAPLVYTSECMLALMQSTLGAEQKYWIANYAIKGTGLAPNQFSATLRNDASVAAWQYTDDNLLLFERGIRTAYTTTGDFEELDRNLMRQDFFKQYTE